MTEIKSEKHWVQRVIQAKNDDKALKKLIPLTAGEKNLKDYWQDFSDTEGRQANFEALETLLALIKKEQDGIDQGNCKRIFELAKSFYIGLGKCPATDLEKAHYKFWQAIFNVLPQEKVQAVVISEPGDEETGTKQDQSKINQLSLIYEMMLNALGTRLKEPNQKKFKAQFFSIVEKFRQNNEDANFQVLDRGLYNNDLAATFAPESKKKKEMSMEGMLSVGELTLRAKWVRVAPDAFLAKLDEVLKDEKEIKSESGETDLTAVYQDAWVKKYNDLRAGYDQVLNPRPTLAQFREAASSVLTAAHRANDGTTKDASDARANEEKNKNTFWNKVFNDLPNGEMFSVVSELNQGLTKYLAFLECFREKLLEDQSRYQWFIDKAGRFIRQNDHRLTLGSKEQLEVKAAFESLRSGLGQLEEAFNDKHQSKQQSPKKPAAPKDPITGWDVVWGFVFLPMTIVKWFGVKLGLGSLGLFTEKKSNINLIPFLPAFWFILLGYPDKFVKDYPDWFFGNPRASEALIRAASILVWVVIGFALPYVFAEFGFIFALSMVPEFLALEGIAIVGFTSGAQVFTMLFAATYAFVYNAVHWAGTKYEWAGEFQDHRVAPMLAQLSGSGIDPYSKLSPDPSQSSQNGTSNLQSQRSKQGRENGYDPGLHGGGNRGGSRSTTENDEDSRLRDSVSGDQNSTEVRVDQTL